MVMVEAKKTMAMAARRSFQSQLRFFKVHRSGHRATMFDVLNPATGQTIAELPDDSAEEVRKFFFFPPCLFGPFSIPCNSVIDCLPA
jgi:hypothetical protein